MAAFKVASFFCKTKSDDILVKRVAIKGGHGYGCNTNFACQPFAKFSLTQIFFWHRQIGNIGALKIGAFAWQQLKFGF